MSGFYSIVSHTFTNDAKNKTNSITVWLTGTGRGVWGEAYTTNFKEQYLMLIFYLKLLLQQEKRLILNFEHGEQGQESVTLACSVNSTDSPALRKM